MGHASDYVESGLVAVVGGIVAVALLFAGLGVGALAIGLAVTFVGAALLSSKRAGPGQLRVVLGFSFVFAVLSWPVLALVAGAIWGHWE